MKWTKQEIKDLKRQLKDQVAIDDIKIAGRSRWGIRYKIYSLGIKIVHWKNKEIRELKRSLKAGQKPWEITLPGRSKLAIRNKVIRLGIWQPKKRYVREWSVRELKMLQHLVTMCGYTAKMLVRNGHLKNRSKDSIQQQIRRNGFKRSWSS